MKRLLALSLAAAVAAPPAFAAPSGLEAAFRNTIVSTYPDGRTAHLWLNADGSYRAQGRRKTASSGRWTTKGEKICLRQKKPLSVPFAYCAQIRSGGVGTSWTDKAVTGERIRVAVVAGR